MFTGQCEAVEVHAKYKYFNESYIFLFKVDVFGRCVDRFGANWNVFERTTPIYANLTDV